MNQTRFYVMQNVSPAVQVSLLVGGLPPLLAKEDYIQLLQEHLAVKSESHLSSAASPSVVTLAFSLQVTWSQSATFTPVKVSRLSWKQHFPNRLS